MPSKSLTELEVNATNISGVVYELSRLAHDRLQMQHEDREGKLLLIIQQQVREYECLKTELQDKEETISDLQRQIVKNKKTGNWFLWTFYIIYLFQMVSCNL